MTTSKYVEGLKTLHEREIGRTKLTPEQIELSARKMKEELHLEITRTEIEIQSYEIDLVGLCSRYPLDYSAITMNLYTNAHNRERLRMLKNLLRELF